MTLLTVEGTYTNGKIELAEAPDGVGDGARVLVTFLPAKGAEIHEQAGREGDVESREVLRQRAIARMRVGLDLGGPPYPKREELYDRFTR